MNIADLPVHIKELAVEAERADTNMPWEQFIQTCRDAGYRILEERPDANTVLIVHERYEDK